jgi:predicted nucleic acid-binding protein
MPEKKTIVINMGPILAQVSAISNALERQEVLALLEKFDSNYTTNSSSLRNRANELFHAGFGLGDAAHLAYAESTSDIFISCDDKLLKKNKKENILIPTINPIEFVIKEELQ